MPFRFPRRICAQTHRPWSMVQVKASAQASGFGINGYHRQLVNTRQSINSKQSANNRQMMRAGAERARAANVREAMKSNTKTLSRDTPSSGGGALERSALHPGGLWKVCRWRQAPSYLSATLVFSDFEPTCARLRGAHLTNGTSTANRTNGVALPKTGHHPAFGHYRLSFCLTHRSAPNSNPVGLPASQFFGHCATICGRPCSVQVGSLI